MASSCIDGDRLKVKLCRLSFAMYEPYQFAIVILHSMSFSLRCVWESTDDRMRHRKCVRLNRMTTGSWFTIYMQEIYRFKNVVIGFYFPNKWIFSLWHIDHITASNTYSVLLVRRSSGDIEARNCIAFQLVGANSNGHDRRAFGIGSKHV